MNNYILKNDEDCILALNEVQKIELDILLKFKEICDKYSLHYSLAYGTLLGSIRHQGFIPWDDDVDVMMPRKDYMKFLSVAKTELMKTNYSVASMHNESNYFAPLTKMYDTLSRVYQFYGQKENLITGVYIDIFIIDYLPDKNGEFFYKKAEKKRNQWALASRDIFAKHKSKNIFRDFLGNIVSIFYKIAGWEYYRNSYDTFCARCPESSNMAVIVYGEGYHKEKMDATEVFNESIVSFEGHFFKAVKDPDKYLTSIYGDYMVLPPVEKRISKHSNLIVKIKRSNNT